MKSNRDIPPDYLLRKLDQSIRFRLWMALAVALKAVRAHNTGEEQAVVEPVLRLIRGAMKDLMQKDLII